MTIDTKTAQLILDALAWCNDEWVHANDEDEWSDSTKIMVAREDFINFCNARGITSVEVIK